jgi:N-formylglutamate amidohydrolase
MEAYTVDGIKDAVIAGEQIAGKLDGTSIILSLKMMEVPYLGLAIHSGTKLPAEIQKTCLLSDQERSRIEDCKTEAFILAMGNYIYTEDSRFLYDLNRSKGTCLYEKRRDLWGVQIDESHLNDEERKTLNEPIWKEPFSHEQKRLYLAKHDLFYSLISFIAEYFLKRNSRALFFDMHSYNWKARSHQYILPDVNLGTRFVDQNKHRDLISHWKKELEKIEIQRRRLIVLENALFRGGYLTRFVSKNYPDIAVLCSEFKKIYMDEETGEIYPEKLDRLKKGIEKTIIRLLDILLLRKR